MAELLGNSWRTTLAGLVVLACGMILLLRGSMIEHQVIGGGLITAGLGLVKARDEQR